MTQTAIMLFWFACITATKSRTNHCYSPHNMRRFGAEHTAAYIFGEDNGTHPRQNVSLF